MNNEDWNPRMTINQSEDWNASITINHGATYIDLQSVDTIFLRASSTAGEMSQSTPMWHNHETKD